MLEMEKSDDRVLIAPELIDFVRKREFKGSPKKAAWSVGLITPSKASLVTTWTSHKKEGKR